MRNRIIIILLCLVAFFSASGQLNLEKVYDYSLTSTKINQTDYKYYLMDVPGSQCRIYNTDHSLWKTIPVSLPVNYYLSDIKFVSQNLFNNDPLVELWYSAYEWVSSGTSNGYYRYISKVISETGTVLASITGGAYAYIEEAGPETYKLVVYAFDNSVTPYKVKTYLFALPNPSSAVNFLSSLPGEPFPNPAGDFINLPMSGHGRDNIVQVFSVSGGKMAEGRTDGSPFYRLSTHNWAPGIYTYRLITDGQPAASKQFIIR